MDNHEEHKEAFEKTAENLGIHLVCPTEENKEMPVTAHDSPRNWDEPKSKPPPLIGKLDALLKEEIKPAIGLDELAQELGLELQTPVEDVELTALRKFIMSTGVVLSTVAYHIVSLCSQPMMVPSTTTWDFKDRANVPDMVFALLKQPGYIEGIWPALKVVMGTNIGNETWTAGIATTLAFFDTVKMLPVLKEMRVLEDGS